MFKMQQNLLVTEHTVEQSTEQVNQSKTILSFREAAIYLALSKSTLYKMTSKKTIPHYCPGGKLIYFRRIDLENFMLQNRRATVEEIGAEAISKFHKRNSVRRK
jgi:excisionase family DNA binding protein